MFNSLIDYVEKTRNTMDYFSTMRGIEDKAVLLRLMLIAAILELSDTIKGDFCKNRCASIINKVNYPK